MFRHFTAIVAATIILFTSVLRADTLRLVSTIDQGQKGSFAGSIDYDASHALLTISLTNTTATHLGGYLTAFAFNIDGPSTAALRSTRIDDVLTTSFQLFSNVSAAPYGTFEYAASIGTNGRSNFADGGKPSAGIAPGDTGTFTFSITGPGAPNLTALDFFSFPSSGSDADHAGLLAARFRGFNDGSSAKVLAQMTGSDLPSGTVPLPTALPAGLLLVTGLALRRTVRRTA